MTIRVVCDSCDASFRFADEDAGLSYQCPKCGNHLTLPELEPIETIDHDQSSAVKQSSPTDQSSLPDQSPLPTQFEAEPEPLMKPTKEINFEDLIDMTAMVDIVFFLLIFFLVTSLQAVDSAIDMPRPDAQHGRARNPVDAPDEGPARTEITVRIDRADRITIDDAEVRGPDELFVRLRDLRNGPDHPTQLLVIGNGDATHGTLVSVLDSGQELGFEKIRISVVDDDQQAAGR